MKYISLWIILLGLTLVVHADMLSNLKDKIKTIGKQTPIDIEVYAKNPSTICSLKITNVSNPYKRDITEAKLEPIVLGEGRYFKGNIYSLLKGAYEFEYKWDKDDKFVDSRLKTVHIFAYHDSRNRVYKKVNLTFLLKVPKGCK